MTPDPHKSLRDHLLYLLRGGGASTSTLKKRLATSRPIFAAARFSPVPHTPWRLLEHIRIAQWDILEFSRNPKHVSPQWPDGYWPKGDAPPNNSAWDRSVEAFRADLSAMSALVTDPATDLFAPIPSGDGQTVLREAAYWSPITTPTTSARLVVVRRLLGCWPEEGWKERGKSFPPPNTGHLHH